MEFTNTFQKDEIRRIWNAMKDQAKGQTFDKDTQAEILMGQCDGMTFDEAADICGQIEEGITLFHDMWMPDGPAGCREIVEKMMRCLPEEMSEEEKKGWMLMSIQSMGGEIPEDSSSVSERAMMTVEELQGVMAETLKDFSENVIINLSENENVSEATAQEDEALVLSEDDAYFLAMAEYAASVNGVCPMKYQQSPVLLGLCFAAQMQMVWLYESEPDKRLLKEFLEAVVMTLAGAALTVAVVLATRAAESVLLAAESGFIVFLCGCLEMGLCVLGALGGCMLVAGISTVLTMGVQALAKKFEKRRHNKQKVGRKLAASQTWTEPVEHSSEYISEDDTMRNGMEAKA